MTFSPSRQEFQQSALTFATRSAFIICTSLSKVSGFLVAGIKNIDIRRKTEFFYFSQSVKKYLPEKYKNRPETSLAIALMSATLATLTCYPLDTVRRQMQIRGSPYNTVLDAIPGSVARDGLIGLYRGFVPNALKNLPSSSIRLTTFDTVKSLIAASEKEYQIIAEENRRKAKLSSESAN